MTKDLYAEFSVLPGHEERVSEMISAHIEAVRSEPGNQLFLPYVLTDRPASYFIVERYADEHAFEDHLASAHSMVFNSEIGQHIEGGETHLTWLGSFRTVV